MKALLANQSGNEHLGRLAMQNVDLADVGERDGLLQLLREHVQYNFDTHIY